MPLTTRSTLVADSAASAVWTLASRAAGFGRVLLIGFVLGPSYFGNLFQLANQLPWIVFELAVGALLHALMVPALMKSVAAGDYASLQRIAGGFLGLVLCSFTVITAAVMAGSLLVARLLALPIGDPVVQDQFVSAAVPLVLLTAPQLIGYGIAITGQAIQQAMGQFALPAAASIAENLIVIATLGAFGFMYGTGIPLAEVEMTHLLLLGGGSTLGVFVHAVVQWYGVARLDLRIFPSAGWRTPEVVAILRQVPPTAGTAVVNGLRLLALLIAANSVPGGVVAFQLALNVLNLPVALGSKSVAYALLPRLSLFHQRHQLGSFNDSYRRSIGLAAFISVPAAVAAVSFGWYAAEGLAVGEMSTDTGRMLLTYSLAGIAGAIIGDGMYQLATSASYALTDPAGLLIGHLVRLVISAICLCLGLFLFADTVLVLAIAVSMSIGDLVGSLILHLRITRQLPFTKYRLGRSLLRTGAASVLTFGIAGLALVGLGAIGVGQAAPVTVLGVTLLVGLLATVAFLILRAKLDNELADVMIDLRSGLADQPSMVSSR